MPGQRRFSFWGRAMARDPDRFPSPRAMTILAARAVGKIDRDGIRGITGASVEEIDAMANVLVALGLIPIVPGTRPEDIPEILFTQPKEGPDV
jgi:hypothetical protein